MTMSILKMSHQRKPFPSHSITTGPETGHILIHTQGTVLLDSVPFNLLRSLKRLHTTGPLAEEGTSWIYLDGRRGRTRNRTGGGRSALSVGERCWSVGSELCLVRMLLVVGYRGNCLRVGCCCCRREVGGMDNCVVGVSRGNNNLSN